MCFFRFLATFALLAGALQAVDIAYVAEDGQFVVVIDVDTEAVTNTITVGFSPQGVAFTPDGSLAYISNTGGTDSISVINTSSETVIATITFDSSYSFPEAALFSPDGSTAYVGLNDDIGGGNVISVIDVATHSISNTITLANGFLGAISPDGSVFYVLNGFSSDNVFVVDVMSGMVTNTITVGSQPLNVVFLPDGSFAYVANLGSDNVSVIDVATHSVTATIAVGDQPRTIIAAPDGSEVWVNNGAIAARSISVIDTTGPTVTATITIGRSIGGMAFTADSSEVFISSPFGDGRVIIVDVMTRAITNSIILDDLCREIAIADVTASLSTAAQGYQQLDCPGGTTATNKLSWTPLVDTAVIDTFEIYRESLMSSPIATLSGSARQYEDSGRPLAQETYFIVVDGDTDLATQLTVDAL